MWPKMITALLCKLLSCMSSVKGGAAALLQTTMHAPRPSFAHAL